MAAFTHTTNLLNAGHSRFVGASPRLAGPRGGLQSRERSSSTILGAQTLLGTVVSTKMEKTCVVTVKRQVPHPQYGKQVRTSKRFLAHDEEGIAQVGDYVKLVPTRPISKNKHFAVDEIVKKAK